MERGYILHRRPYLESSTLVNLLVDGKGRVDAIARFGRGRRSIKSILQPCQPLIFSLSGKGELKYLEQVEPLSAAIPLQSKSLYSAMYLNELLMRILSEHHAGEQLFVPYHNALMSLAQQFDQQCLRYFEKQLLNDLGLMPSLTLDVNGVGINGQYRYQYIVEQGFVPLAAPLKITHYLGKSLLSFANDNLQLDELTDIRHLMRYLLAPLLGNKPLVSRTLFRTAISSKR